MTRHSNPARVIFLTRGFVAIVSNADYRRVNKYKWRVTQSAGTARRQGNFYAKTDIGGKGIYLHRFIAETPDHLQCDHLNHCTLDCRRENLENVDAKVNLQRLRRKKKRDVRNQKIRLS